MSKLIEKLKRMSQAAPQPMGFRRFEPAKAEIGMLVLAAVTKADKDAAGYVAGADAVILPMDGTAAAKAMPEDSTWGISAANLGEAEAKKAAEQGSDFVVFGLDSIPFVSDDKDGPAKILEIDTTIDERLMRTVDDLPVDVVLISDERDKPRTWRELMKLHYLAAQFSKPILVRVPSNVTASEIQLLWEAGADGISVAVGPGITADLQALRKTIEKLDLPSLRKQKKTSAMLPRMTEETHTHAGEPDEDDEED